MKMHFVFYPPHIFLLLLLEYSTMPYHLEHRKKGKTIFAQEQHAYTNMHLSYFIYMYVCLCICLFMYICGYQGILFVAVCTGLSSLYPSRQAF